MRFFALLLAAAALPLLLVVGLLAGLAIGLASWVVDEAPQPPEHLVPLYAEAGGEVGVPWVAIAAVDGAENGFDLPVPPADHWFQLLYDIEAEYRYDRWLRWCEAHSDPETGAKPSPACDSSPAMPEDTLRELRRMAQVRHQAALRAHIYETAHRLQQHRHLLDANPEAAYAALVPTEKVTMAADLYTGYTLLLE